MAGESQSEGDEIRLILKGEWSMIVRVKPILIRNYFMNYLAIGDLNFLIFIIPGFVTVWSFRFFSRIEKKGEFELLGLSFFWGLLILVIILPVLKIVLKESNEFFNNPYAISLAASFFSPFIGWSGSKIIQWNFFVSKIDGLRIKKENKKR